MPITVYIDCVCIAAVLWTDSTSAASLAYQKGSILSQLLNRGKSASDNTSMNSKSHQSHILSASAVGANKQDEFMPHFFFPHHKESVYHLVPIASCQPVPHSDSFGGGLKYVFTSFLYIASNPALLNTKYFPIIAWCLLSKFCTLFAENKKN